MAPPLTEGSDVVDQPRPSHEATRSDLPWMDCPEMKLPSLEARNTYAGPSSEGSE